MKKPEYYHERDDVFYRMDLADKVSWYNSLVRIDEDDCRAPRYPKMLSDTESDKKDYDIKYDDDADNELEGEEDERGDAPDNERPGTQRKESSRILFAVILLRRLVLFH
jgi:hypothetical protein